MTRKDYLAIEKALRAAEFDAEGLDTRGVIRAVAERLADVFEEDNSHFSRGRFLYFVEMGKDTRFPKPYKG